MSRIANLYQNLAQAFRSDSFWSNPLTGSGDMTRDPNRSWDFEQVVPLDDQFLANLFAGSAMTRRIVSAVPSHALRRGFTLTGPDPAQAKAIQDALVKGLKLIRKYRRAKMWGNLFGGCIAVMGVDDGGSSDQPLNEAAIRSFTFLDVHDKRQVSRARRYMDPMHPKFRQTELYRVNYVWGGTTLWHESRVLRFGGAETSEQETENLDGWDYSVMQAAYPAVQRYETAQVDAQALFRDASQGVFKMRGLLQAVTGGKIGLADIATRLRLLDMSRGIARALFLDAESGEDFTKVATNFSGAPDMLDRRLWEVSAATGIPVTKLAGQAPAGLNATGEGDIRNWYDEVEADRQDWLDPKILRAAYLMGLALRFGPIAGLGVTYPSLYQETPDQKATRYKTVSEGDGNYIDRQVFSPEEVAAARSGEGGMDRDIVADMSLRRIIPAPKPPKVEHIPAPLPPEPPAPALPAPNGAPPSPPAQ